MSDSHDPYTSHRDPYGRPDPYARPVPPPNDAADDDGEDDVYEAEDEAPLELGEHMLADAPRKGLDFERGMSRMPPVTIGLIVLLTIVFVWEVAVGALQSEEKLLRAGALQRKAVLAGEYWRIPTSTLLHGSADHLLGNCLGLYLMGLAVEHAFGSLAAGGIYAAAGVIGAGFCVAFEGHTTVGASGAIFGWWGAAIAFYARFRTRLLTRDTRVGFVLVLWAGWTILTGFLNPQISNFSHLGGLLAGAAIAWFCPVRIAELRHG